MRIGSLCSGYGGLDMAAEALTGGKTVWVSDVDKGANKILAHRYPDVPNLGDFTVMDWSTVEPIEMLTAGYPCQPFSHAGKRAGTNDTRHLWPEVLRALTELRPPFALFENVRGHLSLGFDQVLADLATHDYDARWIVLRAADIGAPHGRARLFILASDARRGGDRWDLVGAGRGSVRVGGVRGEDPERGGDAGGANLLGGMTLLKTPTAQLAINGGSQHPDKRKAGGHGPTLADKVEHLLSPFSLDGDPQNCLNWSRHEADWLDGNCPRCPDVAEREGQLLPTPTRRDYKNAGDPSKTADRMADRGQPLTEVACNVLGPLLPTPAVNDMGAAYTPDEWDAWTDRMKAEHGNGNGHGKSLSIEAQRLLPTPRTQNNENRQSEGYGGEDGNFYGLLQNPERWGDYAPAIHRWEQILGRPAPAPTMTSTKGNPQLSPRFVEWMMGLPEGWVDDVPDLTRNEKLKALGNGVVSQQAVEAVLRLLALGSEAAA